MSPLRFRDSVRCAAFRPYWYPRHPRWACYSNYEGLYIYQAPFLTGTMSQLEETVNRQHQVPRYTFWSANLIGVRWGRSLRRSGTAHNPPHAVSDQNRSANQDMTVDSFGESIEREWLRQSVLARKGPVRFVLLDRETDEAVVRATGNRQSCCSTSWFNTAFCRWAFRWIHQVPGSGTRILAAESRGK
jgi:hypothetical protein